MGESIVVGTDGSETAGRAVDEAVRLAGILGGTVHVVTAYKPMHGHVDSGPEKFEVLSDSVARPTIEQAAARIRAAGVDVETHLLSRDPTDALLDVAERVDASLIVVGSQGMSGAKRVLGSVPNSVSHRSWCNVLIVATSERVQ